MTTNPDAAAQIKTVSLVSCAERANPSVNIGSSRPSTNATASPPPNTYVSASATSSSARTERTSRSAGGASIIALPSTGGRDGAISRIVPRLTAGAAVTTPRFLADWIVTEHGAARVKGLGETARATALIAVAHPRFRAELERALSA